MPINISTAIGDSQITTSSTPATPEIQQQPSVTQTTAAENAAAAPTKQPEGWLAWQHVAAQTWRLALAMFLLYVVTLFIFPGVLAEDAQVGWANMQQHSSANTG